MKYKIALISIVSLFFVANVSLASVSAVSCTFVADNGSLTPSETTLVAGEVSSVGTWNVNIPAGSTTPEVVTFNGSAYAYDDEHNWAPVTGSAWSLSGSNIGNSEDGSLNYSITRTGDLFSPSTQEVTGTIDGVAFSCSPLDVHVYSRLTMSGCSAPISTAVFGQAVGWSVNYSGGTSPYTFSWIGDEPISSITTSPANASYSSAGMKYASSTGITSGDGQSWAGNISCGAPVQVENDSITVTPTSTLLTLSSASCSVSSTDVKVGDTVTWTANITGGLSPYYINWSGTDGFSSNSQVATMVYTSTSTKTATFSKVTDSNGVMKRVTVSCPSVNVTATTTTTDNGGNTGGSTHSQRSTGGTGTIGTTTGGTTGTLGFGSSTQNTLGSTTAGVSGITPISLTGNVLNPNNSSSSLATASNGTSSAGIAGSSTESGINLAAAAASASGSATKYAWYIAGIVLLALIGWLAYFLIKRNKKDKIS